MRCVRLMIASAMLGVFFVLGVPVSAAVVIPPGPIPTPETLPTSPLLLTAYQITGSSLQFVQLYNNSSNLIALDNGHLQYSYASDAAAISRLALTTEGLIEPRSHVLISVDGLLDVPAVAQFVSTAASTSTTISTLTFEVPGFAPSTVPVSLKTNSSIQQRGKTSTGYSTVTFGDFSGDLYADRLYEIPLSPPLRVVEISPRAKSCEPYSLDPTCGDFIKFKIMPGYDDGVLERYRVRTDEGSESVTNTFSMSYASRHGDYLLMRLRDDGQLLTLTNSSGYVWVEDHYGAERYDETLTRYENATSEKYIDQSWAFDEVDSTWKWGIPSPVSANLFPQVLAANTVESDSSDCPAGKYRNPETNRCRSIEETVSALAICEEGKERNPLTNRCRGITATTSSLTPCSEGQERNPATNRCRALTSAGPSLVPCSANYERNPDTNRCRKMSDTVSSLSVPAVAEIGARSSDALKNAVIITAGLGALSYGFYEWRSELLRAIRRFVALVAGR